MKTIKSELEAKGDLCTRESSVHVLLRELKVTKIFQYLGQTNVNFFIGNA